MWGNIERGYTMLGERYARRDRVHAGALAAGAVIARLSICTRSNPTTGEVAILHDSSHNA